MEILDESTILQQCEADTVLVVPLPDRQMNEPPGFLSEEHVISRYFLHNMSYKLPTNHYVNGTIHKLRRQKTSLSQSSKFYTMVYRNYVRDHP